MMHKMRTRSSRCLFVVLLHLVGVAQWPNVLPFSIGLEEIALDHLASIPDEPVWLQDAADDLCLGPMGRFVECGDATLWQVNRLRRKRLRMGLFGIEDASVEGWKFHIVDDVDQIKRRRSECLRNKDGTITVERCSRVFSILSSTWDMKDDGSLQSLRVDNAPLCVMRTNHTATLSSCNDRRQRKVHFTMVRYRAVVVPGAAPSADPTQVEQLLISADDGSEPLTKTSKGKGPVQPRAGNTGSPAFPQPSPTTNLLSSNNRLMPSKSTSNPPTLGGDRTAQKKSRQPPTLKSLHDTNPILLMGAKSQTSSLLLTKLSQEIPSGSVAKLSSSNSPTLQPLRRMEIHPYIAAAKNELWMDPQTGLEYHTDLCRYLGRGRKEYGRHTLMGVGQYRKGYVIKVYGVAFYVSKRDALTDGSLAPYAGLSAEELRARPDFYQLLRNMNPASVDRTLLLKTNMQLSAEVMRNSLHADWQYLTAEAKTTLISSSMQAREADAEMLRIIQRPDNPSRCSCSQVAPESYQADPTCCARGTELAFTWLKNGRLEVRLNRRLMDSFPRPDIAEGIFYEYLRYDDPISPELRERVVDGFPFLLAPLAQVKGVSIGQRPGFSKSQGSNPVVRAMSSLAESVTTNVAELTALAQRSASETASHFVNAARTVSDSADSMSKEFVRRRDSVMRQMMAIPESITNLFSPQADDDAIDAEETVSDAAAPLHPHAQVRKESLGRAFGYPLSRWFSETYQAPDEIGPMKIHPTMTTTRKVFLAFVHLYLLLLFIVSFPGSYTTRTKVLVRRTKSLRSNKDGVLLDATVTSDDDHSDLSLDSRGSPRSAAMKLAPGSHDRIKCKNRRLSKRGILRRALGPSVSDDIQDELSNGSSNIRLKKKSLSYFL